MCPWCKRLVVGVPQSSISKVNLALPIKWNQRETASTALSQGDKKAICLTVNLKVTDLHVVPGLLCAHYFSCVSGVPCTVDLSPLQQPWVQVPAWGPLLHVPPKQVVDLSWKFLWVYQKLLLFMRKLLTEPPENWASDHCFWSTVFFCK